MRDRGRTALYLLAPCALCLVAMGCVGAAQEEEVEVDPYTTPLTVQLRGVVAGVIGNGILLENHSAEKLENVEIVINPGQLGGGFRFRVPSIGSNTTNPFVSRVFRNEAGLSFEDAGIEPTGFAVYADTPRGRGSWSGQYGPSGN